MMPTLNKIAALLLEQEDIVIISHRAPDGDTLGSAVALGLALRQAGKHVDFLCNDLIPQKYHYLFDGVPEWLQKKEDPVQAAEGKFLVTVDIADVPLMGDALAPLSDRIDLCIDHHKMSVDFANVTYREADSAATGEIIYGLLREMGTTIDQQIATCIYTAVSTDTGCFKYINTTPRSYRIAADLVEAGAPAADINRWMFDTISRPRLELQKLALETVEYHYDGRCVTMVISREMMKQAGAAGEDVEGINAIPRQIDGALVGVTIREKKTGGYKISMRSQPPVDSSVICASFGGGGHAGAAGCMFDDPLDVVKQKLVDEIGRYFQKIELL